MRFLALCRRAFLAAILLQAAAAIAAHPAQANPKTAKAAPAPASAPARMASRPFRSGADPSADPNESLISCMNHVGINPLARDRCMRQHCEGHWGEGECPAGGDFLPPKGTAAGTPLGQCLINAGSNPFKRTACGWKYCRSDWNTPECAPLKGGRKARPN